MHSSSLLLLAGAALSFALPEMRLERRTEAPPTNGTEYPGNCEWNLLGCYIEPTVGKVLKFRTPNSGDDSLTPQRCLDYCENAGYSYAFLMFRRWV